MENNQEQKERERLQEEAEDEREKTIQRFKSVVVFWGHVGFDMSDPQTRLICKVPPQIAVWTSPEHKTVHVVQLYWRTKDGNYFKFMYDEEGAIPLHVDIEQAHYMMNTKKNCLWFLTDAQLKELEEEDERIKLGKASGLI